MVNFPAYRDPAGPAGWIAELKAYIDAAGGAPAAGAQVAMFSRAGFLAVTPGAGRYLMPAAGTITGVTAAVNTAPTGAAVLVDINKNGTTIFTTQGNRPSIAASGYATSASAVPDVTSFAAGDYFTVDIDQVGSTVAGADLTVFVSYTFDVSGSSLINFSRAGMLAVSPGVSRFLAPAALTVSGIILAVNTAPTGAAILCDLNKNGTTMFSTQGNRPSIAIGANATASAAVPDVTSVAAGDYLTVDVDQVGSTIAGSDLTAHVIYSLT